MARPDAYELALRALERKERTAAELRGWLEARGCEPDAVEAAVARLEEVGALDDERFAQRFAADKRELRDWGSERIRATLAARGLDPELVERAVGSPSHDDEVERARAALARRGAPLDGDGARARALGFLTRRGYDYEIAYEAIRRAA